MDYGIQSPWTWSSGIVLSWAFREDLPSEVSNALCSKEVDGVQLISFTDETLRTGLGIRDAAARENLLNRIAILRMEAMSLDYGVALGEFEKERNKDETPPAASLVAAYPTPHPGTTAPTGFMSKFVQKCRKFIDYNIQNAPAPAFAQVAPTPTAVRDSPPPTVKASEEDDRKPAASANPLPILDECNICYDTNIRGYQLACDHKQCASCMSTNLQAALRDPSLLPLRCCNIPIDMNVANSLLSESDIQKLQRCLLEKESSNHMYCPKCRAFVNLEWVAAVVNNVPTIVCDCRAVLCVQCKTLEHRGLTCSANHAQRTGSDDSVLALSRKKGWKRCPKCRTMIEKNEGCNHMTCINCRYHFCFKCLSKWDTKKYVCSAKCR